MTYLCMSVRWDGKGLGNARHKQPTTPSSLYRGVRFWQERGGAISNVTMREGAAVGKERKETEQEQER
jgi:hypothetical protein